MSEKTKVFLEIYNLKTEEVERRFEVTEKSERQRDRLERGIRINLGAGYDTRTVTE